MPIGSITSVNAQFFITVPLIFPAPVALQEFTADDIFDTEDVDVAETSMGLDGVLSGGWINMPTPQTIALQANSPSNDLFDTWRLQERAAQDKFPANAVILLPGIHRKWTMTRGFLQRTKPIPDAKKTLQPRRFRIVWQDGVPSPA